MYTKTTSPRAQQQLLAWLARWNPKAYRLAMRSPGLGAADAGGSWGDRLFALVTPALQAYNQQKIMRMQIQRAASGLPPLPTAQLAPPPMTAQVGLDPGTTKLIGFGIAGLAAVLVLPKLLAKGRN